MAKKEFNSIEEIVNDRNSIQTQKKEKAKTFSLFFIGHATCSLRMNCSANWAMQAYAPIIKYRG